MSCKDTNSKSVSETTATHAVYVFIQITAYTDFLTTVVAGPSDEDGQATNFSY
jgi:hypothetical protein